MRRLLVVGLLCGCYRPHVPAGVPCANGACPTGLVCSPATQTCETTPVGADAAVAPDARVDARLDAPPAGTPDAAVPAYAYARTITIRNNATEAMPAGFPVTVPLDPLLGQLLAANKVRSDYADLRVMGAGPLGERDRIVDPAARPGPAAVTFALGAPIAGGATSSDYTLVYGNPAAGAAPASGAAVFPVYDDFNAGVGSGWLRSGTPTASQNGQLILHANAADGIATDAATDGLPIISAIELVARPLDQTSDAGASGYYYWFGYQRMNDFTPTDPWALWVARAPSSLHTEQKSPTGCYPTECDGTTIAQDGAWHAYAIVRDPDETRFYRDGALADTITVQNTEDYAVMVRNYLATSELRVDWIRARPRVSPDPTVTLGAEESF